MAQQKLQPQKAPASKSAPKSVAGKPAAKTNGASKAPVRAVVPAQSTQRKVTRNEKIFYVISLLIIVSMVLGSVAMMFTQ